MKNILIPIDGSSYSMKAMEKGKEFAKAFGANIVLLHVKSKVNISNYTQGELRQYSLEQYQIVKEGFEVHNYQLSEQSKKLLKDAKDYFWDLEEGAVSTIGLDGDAASAILQYIESNEKEIDLVIMGSKGVNAGKIRGLFIGSVTTKVMSSTKVPILVIK